MKFQIVTIFAILLCASSSSVADFKCKLPSSYKTDPWLKPTELHGDFFNDGIDDIAIQIREVKTKRLGIAICNSKINKFFILGAGRKLGHCGASFDWMDLWSVHKGPIEQGATGERPPVFNGNAILVEKDGSASAVIYFDGENFRSYQQGD